MPASTHPLCFLSFRPCAVSHAVRKDAARRRDLVSRVNIVKRVKIDGRWKMFSIPRNAKGNYDWNAIADGRYYVEWYVGGTSGRVSAGVPAAQALERRPDIRVAEQNLVAANANIGVAKAMFFPQISLLGSGGAAFGHSAFLGANIPAPLGLGSYAASLTQPIFEGGALRNNLRYAKSQERQALIGYQQTIRQAFGDVSDALIGYDKYHSVRERQEQSVKDLEESVKVSLMLYKGGIAT